MKTGTLVLVLMAVLAGAALFRIKYEVRELEDRLAGLDRAVLGQQQALQVLNAEWAYLDRPQRIETLGARLLGMAPLRRDQIVRLDELDAVLAAGIATAKVPAPRRRPARAGRAPAGEAAWLAGIVARTPPAPKAVRR
jgi:cell division protein FtsL